MQRFTEPPIPATPDFKSSRSSKLASTRLPRGTDRNSERTITVKGDVRSSRTAPARASVARYNLDAWSPLKPLPKWIGANVCPPAGVVADQAVCLPARHRGGDRRPAHPARERHDREDRLHRP